jgi:carbon-monoxide dehydrogenase iron sulfur subunit
MQYGIVQVRPERCMSCKRCVLACAVAHSQSKELIGAIKEFPRPHPRVSLNVLGELTVPTECKHCDGAACVMVCPSGAMTKPGAYGPVVLDQESCVGCGHCVLACPYGVPQYVERGLKVTKCDQCMDRLEQGLEPACVEACPTRTLLFERQAEVSLEEAANSASALWKRIETMRKKAAAVSGPAAEPAPEPARKEV